VNTDLELKSNVLAELDWEPSVDAARIGVCVENGVVTLTGHVAVFAEKQLAEEAAKRVKGVKAVANDIEVLLGKHHQRDDTDIAAAAVRALEWNAKVPHENLQVTVMGGRVHLEGVVQHNHQKELAERIVRSLVGVRGVTNAVRVEPSQEHRLQLSEDRAAMCRRVEEALRRNAVLASRNICVEIHGHTVILSGDVRSHSEVDAAERAAWAAPGVDEVDCTITITPFGTGPAEEWGY
jgi:osmotically-inducible protein OsmY